ncbi:MAG: S8 family serine peptidase [Roseomonas sp.]
MISLHNAMVHRRFANAGPDEGLGASDDVHGQDGVWLAPIAIAEVVVPTQTPAPSGDSAWLAEDAWADAVPVDAYAEPMVDETAVSIAAVSNDPGYTSGMLWGMLGDTGTVQNAYGSQANEAWADGITGSTSSVVGVIDTGIDYTHPDLYLNIWLNQREIPTALRASLSDIDADGLITFRDLNGAANASYVMDYNRNGRIDAGDLLNDRRWENGLDDDGDGYRDDLVGWDFANNDNDPFDDHGHGTHVAGTIGAMGGNGVGVAGVNWTIQMVAMKFLSASGSGSTTGAVNAVNYFTDAAIHASGAEDFIATNNSWGGGGYSASLHNAIGRAAQEDILFIAAAGNSSSNNDVQANYPSNYSTTAIAGYESVVAVASLTNTGALSSFSSYGATTVDIAAPGSAIYSTLPGGRYGTYSGTSMATPHVTGAVALFAAENPNATAAEIRAALLDSAAATPSLGGRVVTGGRLDIDALLDTSPSQPVPVDAIAGNNSTTASLSLSAGQLSTVDFAGDQDWFRLTLTAGWRYTFAMDAEGGSSLDPYLRLLNGNGQQLAFDDDASGLNSRISFTVTASGTYYLSAQGDGASTGAYNLSMSAVEADRVLNGTTGNDSLNGASGNDSLNGQAGNDRLVGFAGNDTLSGLTGNDTLDGGLGNDLLIGGVGRDILTGGGGADVFRFLTLADSAVGSSRDVITAFSRVDGDRIDLAMIDANTRLAGDEDFSFIGSAGFSRVAGQLRFAGGVLQADVNGDARADMEIAVQGVSWLLTADFIL